MPASPQVLSEIAAGGGLPLTQTAKRFPSFRRGRPVHSTCVLRWILHGYRLPSGEIVYLEAARVSGRWLTTVPAITRFLAAQNPRAEDGDAPAAPTRTPTQRQRASERAARELEKIGI